MHLTDVTNASRTMLMNLETLDWDDELLALFSIPRQMLPRVTPSSSRRRHAVTVSTGPVRGEVPIAGILGDQQSAMVGQVCLSAGRPRTPTAPETSCCSTPVNRSSARRTGC